MIWVDMDDVLADFVGGFCDAMKIDRSILPVGIYGIENHIPGFWETLNNIGPAFWRGLKPINTGLVGLVQQYGDVAILTSPQAKGCADAKIAWAEQHYPGIPIFLGKEKFRVQGILIDDSPYQIDAFNERWPGNGILFPTSHNRLHYVPDAVNHIKFMLEARRW